MPDPTDLQNAPDINTADQIMGADAAQEEGQEITAANPIPADPRPRPLVQDSGTGGTAPTQLDVDKAATTFDPPIDL